MTFKKAAANFIAAAKAFKETTAALHPFVEKELKRRNTIPELQELIEMLPVSYIGTRKIYEKMIQLEDKGK